MTAYKSLPGMEGATYYYYDIPKNPVNDWLVTEHYEALQRAAGFLHRRRHGGRHRARRGAEEDRRRDRHREADRGDGRHELRDAEGQDDLPQGRPPGAAVDVPLQDQGRPGGRVGHPRAGARDQAGGDEDPDPQQAADPFHYPLAGADGIDIALRWKPAT